MAAKQRVILAGEPHDLEFEERGGTLFARVDAGEWQSIRLEAAGSGDEAVYILFISSRPYLLTATTHSDGYAIALAGRVYRVVTESRRRQRTAGHKVAVDEAAGGEVTIRSTMAGVVVEVLVRVGDAVQGGQTLLVIEAMKMQNELHAPRSGNIVALHVGKGDRVERGTALLVLR